MPWGYLEVPTEAKDTNYGGLVKKGSCSLVFVALAANLF
jgi:hypothetical protein